MNSRTKGIVLISILLIVLLLSSVAVLFGNKYFLSLKRAEYIEFQTLSLNIFRNIEALSKEKIEKELKFNRSKISKNNPILKDNFYFNLNSFFYRFIRCETVWKRLFCFENIHLFKQHSC